MTRDELSVLIGYFESFVEALLLVADCPTRHYDALLPLWMRLARHCGINDHDCEVVIDPLRNAQRSYDHVDALFDWAMLMMQRLKAGEVSFAEVRSRIPVPWVYRSRRDRILVPQLDLFTPPSRSG